MPQSDQSERSARTERIDDAAAPAGGALSGEACGAPSGETFGTPGGEAFGTPGGEAFGAPGGEAFGTPSGEAFGLAGTRSLSRRRFAQLFGAGAAAAGAAGLAAAVPAGAAALLRGAPAGWRGTAALPGVLGVPAAVAVRPGDVVRLSSNENPYGPSAAAFDAMREAFGLAWRYPDEHLDALAEDLARLHGVERGQVLLGAGSSEILQLAALAFTAPGRPVVVAEPTFESLPRHARHHGAEALAVPLTADYRHDLPKMLAAAPDPGLLYVCNPNNPTASITPKAELRSLLARVPERTVVLVDEAYHHFVEDRDYESVLPLVAAHPNLLVTRTFSKIYGMAGMRCGYGVAQPALISRLSEHQARDSVNVLGLAAARASLRDAEQVSRGRRLNREVKTALYGELDRLGLAYIRSEANFLMIDVRRPVPPVIQALRGRNVEVGREFPALPHHLRVTIGTTEQMQAFVAAFRQVMAA
ncbi:MAG TPA: histidinol-phosphate transaminase [Thermoanaerobaculia bacterium]|nr:histidinol-phosphate transaminase [Thermoanaerobaculia bacterium]